MLIVNCARKCKVVSHVGDEILLGNDVDKENSNLRFTNNFIILNFNKITKYQCLELDKRYGYQFCFGNDKQRIVEFKNQSEINKEKPCNSTVILTLLTVPLRYFFIFILALVAQIVPITHQKVKQRLNNFIFQSILSQLMPRLLFVNSKNCFNN